MLEGFRSRWTIPLSCATSNAIPSRNRWPPFRSKSDAAHEISEARIGTEVVEQRIKFKLGKFVGMILIASFEPLKCSILITQSSVDDRKTIRRDITMFSNLCQLVEYC